MKGGLRPTNRGRGGLLTVYAGQCLLHFYFFIFRDVFVPTCAWLDQRSKGKMLGPAGPRGRYRVGAVGGVWVEGGRDLN